MPVSLEGQRKTEPISVFSHAFLENKPPDFNVFRFVFVSYMKKEQSAYVFVAQDYTIITAVLERYLHIYIWDVILLL